MCVCVWVEIATFNSVQYRYFVDEPFYVIVLKYLGKCSVMCTDFSLFCFHSLIIAMGQFRMVWNGIDAPCVWPSSVKEYTDLKSCGKRTINRLQLTFKVDSTQNNSISWPGPCGIIACIYLLYSSLQLFIARSKSASFFYLWHAREIFTFRSLLDRNLRLLLNVYSLSMQVHICGGPQVIASILICNANDRYHF